MNWRKWSNDQQAFWVFRMTMAVMALGVLIGLVLEAILR